MNLQTLNRINTLRRMKSRAPKAPDCIKRYHVFLLVFPVLIIISALLKIL